MKKLLIATHNTGKLREYTQLLADLEIELLSPIDIGMDSVQVEETGDTFEENARLKALTYAQASGLPTLADDSGLEVDALDGRPGVHSARYAGPDATDEDRRRKLLAEMRDVPPGRRSARFRCAVALALPDGRVWTADGVCEGEIAFEPRGKGGFGYDPLFIVSGDGRTMAEMAPDEKNLISHRGRALRAAMPLLKDVLGI